MKLSISKSAWILSGMLVTSTAIAHKERYDIESITVFAHPLSQNGAAQASLVLEGEALQRNLSISLGETLAKQAGVHSAAFGAAVGRPVINGLSGPRIRIMQDRIDTLDVSVSSGDHAVSVEPFIAERIEVLKGASSLLYGSGAIGGVVNVHTGRIPQQRAESLVSGGFEARTNSNNDGITTALKLNGGKDNFAWHLDDTRKDGDNYKIPGFSVSELQRQIEDSDDRGRLAGSQFDSEASAIGASYFGERSLFGIAVSTIDANYGLPGGHEEEEGGAPVLPGAPAEEEGEEETPTLVLEQTRVDLEWALEGVTERFTNLNVRVGVNDYTHQEIEPDGEVATVFDNEAWEVRAELRYEGEEWTTVSGVQYTDRQFSAVGEEAFIAPVDTTDSGVFIVTERSFSGFDVEAGLRFGQVDHTPSLEADRDFSTYSVSVGTIVPLTDSLKFAANLDRSSRAPIAEELYSNGPHLVTGTFDRGNIGLDNERATNISASLRYNGDSTSITATAYIAEFTDFIFQTNTGLEEDGLPLFIYQQADASFYGVDISAGVELLQEGDNSVFLNAIFDYVEAELKQGANRNIDRTPPQRFGLGLDAHFGKLALAVDYLYVSSQDDVAESELATDSYIDLGVYMDYSFSLSEEAKLMLFVHAKNLTDEEQRNHNSFIKDVAPAPGRAVELGFRVMF